MSVSLYLNVAILVLEIITFIFVIPGSDAKLLSFYTILSNICAGLASAVFLFLGDASPVSIAIRYLATCMLVLTCIVANFVLIPMGVGFRGILWDGGGLVFHLIAPILSIVSYEFFEPQIAPIGILIPIAVTIVYAVVILLLVGFDKIDPPYPFLRIKEQSIPVSFLWGFIILGSISLIAFLV